MGEETLDRPANNFDVAGIPISQWHSGLFCCHKNIIPSCFLSFFCPCKLWAQIVVRAQIPLLISLKNSLGARFRLNSGYRVFMDFFWIPLALIIGIILILALLKNKIPRDVTALLYILLGSVMVIFVYINGHVRVAVREKYLLPGFIPINNGCAVPNCMIDLLVSCLCLPCSLSQLARHIFQYERWSPSIGLSLGDPSKLEPLEESPRRPHRADAAGLQWADHPRPDDITQFTGAGARQRMEDEAAEAQSQRAGLSATVVPATNVIYSAPPMSNHVPAAAVVVSPPSSSRTYNADGSIYQP